MPTLDAAGLEIDSLEDLNTTMLDELRSTVDHAIGNGPTVVEAQEVAIVASHTREVQEVLAIFVDAINRNNAEGALLGFVGSITGTYKQPATKSKFIGSKRVTFTVAAGETIAAGQRFSMAGKPQIVFVSKSIADNLAGLVTNTIPVDAECEVPGPVEAPAGTMTVKITSATGWLAVNNSTDAVVGRLEEKDLAFRSRQVAELAGSGSGNVNSIRADVLKITLDDGVTKPVLEAYVLENYTSTYDTIQGLPPKSIEVILWDGAGSEAPNADVAAAIFTKAAGIYTNGSTAVTLQDSYGRDKVIRFSRVSQRVLELELTYRVDATAYVGDEVVQAACASASTQGYPSIEGLPQRPSGRAEWSAYAAVAKLQGGVQSIVLVRMRLDGGTWEAFTDQEPGLREIVTLDSANIAIIVV